MARKKKHPEHVNHERWLVSYADFITLLFAFFVVMFAVSQVDSKKLGRFTESFSAAVGMQVFPNPGNGVLSGGPAEQQQEGDKNGGLTDGEENAVENLREALMAAAKDDPTLAALEIIPRGDELVLRISEAIAFDSGDTRVKIGAEKVLIFVAKQMKGRDIDVRVEGHTDDRPIKNSRWRSNWELSTGRAVAVLVLLHEQGVDPTRLAAAGYGEFHPIGKNDSEEGRAKNRRVDIVIIPRKKLVKK